jgi:predicted AAA+ superfamily ATPase
MAFNTVDIDWEYLLERLEHFLDLGEEYMTRRLVEYVPDPQIFEQHLVFRWVRHYAGGYVEKVTHPHLQDHATLLGIEDVIDTLCENTAQFVHGLPANHILLRGESGGGKRTAILGLLKKFDNKGLRLIEIHGEDLHQLAIVIESLRNLPFYFGFITQTKVLPPASVGYLSFLICEPDKPGQNATDS